MIVKILSYSSDLRAEKGSIKWWYYGDLLKISVSPILTESLEEFRKNNDADISVMFSFVKVASNKKIEYRRLICRRSDGNEFSIVFDTVAYLLNDKGETVEKIVVNVK